MLKEEIMPSEKADKQTISQKNKKTDKLSTQVESSGGLFSVFKKWMSSSRSSKDTATTLKAQLSSDAIVKAKTPNGKIPTLPGVGKTTKTPILKTESRVTTETNQEKSPAELVAILLCKPQTAADIRLAAEQQELNIKSRNILSSQTHLFGALYGNAEKIQAVINQLKTLDDKSLLQIIGNIGFMLRPAIKNYPTELHVQHEIKVFWQLAQGIKEALTPPSDAASKASQLLNTFALLGSEFGELPSSPAVLQKQVTDVSNLKSSTSLEKVDRRRSLPAQIEESPVGRVENRRTSLPILTASPSIKNEVVIKSSLEIQVDAALNKFEQTNARLTAIDVDFQQKLTSTYTGHQKEAIKKLRAHSSWGSYEKIAKESIVAMCDLIDKTTSETNSEKRVYLQQQGALQKEITDLTNLLDDLIEGKNKEYLNSKRLLQEKKQEIQDFKKQFLFLSDAFIKQCHDALKALTTQFKPILKAKKEKIQQYQRWREELQTALHGLSDENVIRVSTQTSGSSAPNSLSLIELATEKTFQYPQAFDAITAIVEEATRLQQAVTEQVDTIRAYQQRIQQIIDQYDIVDLKEVVDYKSFISQIHDLVSYAESSDENAITASKTAAELEQLSEKITTLENELDKDTSGLCGTRKELIRQIVSLQVGTDAVIAAALRTNTIARLAKLKLPFKDNLYYLTTAQLAECANNISKTCMEAIQLEAAHAQQYSAADVNNYFYQLREARQGYQEKHEQVATLCQTLESNKEKVIHTAYESKDKLLSAINEQISSLIERKNKISVDKTIQLTDEDQSISNIYHTANKSNQETKQQLGFLIEDINQQIIAIAKSNIGNSESSKQVINNLRKLQVRARNGYINSWESFKKQKQACFAPIDNALATLEQLKSTIEAELPEFQRKDVPMANIKAFNSHQQEYDQTLQATVAAIPAQQKQVIKDVITLDSTAIKKIANEKNELEDKIIAESDIEYNKTTRRQATLGGATVAGATATGAVAGTVVLPGVGTLIGAAIGFAAGAAMIGLTWVTGKIIAAMVKPTTTPIVHAMTSKVLEEIEQVTSIESPMKVAPVTHIQTVSSAKQTPSEFEYNRPTVSNELSLARFHKDNNKDKHDSITDETRLQAQQVRKV